LGRGGSGQSAMMAAVGDDRGVHGHGHGAPSSLGRGDGGPVGNSCGVRGHGHGTPSLLGRGGGEDPISLANLPAALMDHLEYKPIISPPSTTK
jgi:hypothetical protein